MALKNIWYKMALLDKLTKEDKYRKIGEKEYKIEEAKKELHSIDLEEYI